MAERFYRADVLAHRLDAQLLSRADATTPEQVVDRLLAVQAQDPRGMRLAVRARSSGLTQAHVDAALDDGRLVVSWLNRGTLHLVRAEDHWRLFALTTPQLRTASTRRLRQEGVDEKQADRGVEVIAEAVESGPRIRAELKTALDAAGVPTTRQALVHVLFAASLQGVVVRGPMKDGEQAFVPAARWVGPPAEFDEAESLTWLARRYLAGHGPATATDLAKWANIPLGKARKGLAGLRDEVAPRSDGLVDLVGRDEPAPLPPPRLLGVFEPVLCGWVDRSPLLGPHRATVMVGGMYRAFALAGGQAVATWRLTGKRVELDYLVPVSPTTQEALERDGDAVRAFLRAG